MCNEKKIIPVGVPNELHNRFKSACKDNYETMTRVLQRAVLDYSLKHEERVTQQPNIKLHSDN